MFLLNTKILYLCGYNFMQVGRLVLLICWSLECSVQSSEMSDWHCTVAAVSCYYIGSGVVVNKMLLDHSDLD
jgi:hypothetical protein